MKRVFVTGASRGIGLELVRHCLERGDRVFAGARDVDAPGLKALACSRLRVVRLDVASPSSIAECQSVVRAEIDALELLVNNAGIHAFSPEVPPTQRNLAFGELEPEGLLRMLRVNALGPALVTQAFVELLSAARGRVLNLSSRKGSLSQTQEGGNYGYTVSKAALNMVGRRMAVDLRDRGITVVLVHPGRVRTRMGGPEADLEPTASASALLALADRLQPEDSGRFFRWDGSEHPW